MGFFCCSTLFLFLSSQPATVALSWKLSKGDILRYEVIQVQKQNFTIRGKKTQQETTVSKFFTLFITDSNALEINVQMEFASQSMKISPQGSPSLEGILDRKSVV